MPFAPLVYPLNRHRLRVLVGLPFTLLQLVKGRESGVPALGLRLGAGQDFDLAAIYPDGLADVWVRRVMAQFIRPQPLAVIRIAALGLDFNCPDVGRLKPWLEIGVSKV